MVEGKLLSNKALLLLLSVGFLLYQKPGRRKIQYTYASHLTIFLCRRVKTKDKADRATAEQVMDPRTRMILFKLLNRGTLKQIDGCISTGKEANVYHAIGEMLSDQKSIVERMGTAAGSDRILHLSFNL